MKGAGEGRKEVEKGGGRVFRWYAARCQNVSSAASLVPLGYRCLLEVRKVRGVALLLCVGLSGSLCAAYVSCYRL